MRSHFPRLATFWTIVAAHADFALVGSAMKTDSFCARRRERSHGRDEETDFQIEQRN